MSDLLPISAFSRATLLSANTLRSYHESGLLEPAVVDPRTGYRSYRATQLGDATLIKQLRDLDVPLADIRAVLAARDPAVTRRVLATHRERISAQQQRLEQILDATDELLAEPAAATPLAVTERTLPPARAVTLTAEVREADFAPFLHEAYAKLRAMAPVASGPLGALFPAEFSDDPAPVTAFVPVDTGDEVLAGGRFAVAEFVGPYRSMSAGYRALGAWLAGAGFGIAGRVREYYVTGPGDGVPEEDFRTEICWPIESLEN
ncbi:DNA-binding transcriptional MerR regulator [Actinoplanes octamycinicus]|uniref:DNA-binding transcriptional MerR regulator n=1 Tax=Actinoplanes octamycinicus TaxID=135948 RepID=A0A7W7H6L6_9ACTN|nr:MerR family transcriptional regulator [Actinoplanes octamycinicus]MBB4744792.1 DNA-binding transcriptional MerR regulator [Actinoplanes octamycinicus]GIE55375.1 MerR family transcriptional regulator [Actinoplanes octamycinicus]